MTLIDISMVVLIIIASTLSVFIIVFLKKIFEQVEAVQKDFYRLVENTIPVMSNLKEISNRVNRIVTDVEGYWVEIEYSVRYILKMISKFDSWKKILISQTPGLLKNIKPITKGISVFWRKYKQT